jgi:primosomal protein N' (replication factor Y)
VTDLRTWDTETSFGFHSKRGIWMEPGLFADIVVLSPVKPPAPGAAAPVFTYHLPDELQGRLATGSLVVVPFGPRRLYGIVVTLSATSPVPETRPVESLVDPDPVLTPAQINLARWMGREYLAPLWRCLTLMLPPGVIGYADVQVELAGEVEPRDVRTKAQGQTTGPRTAPPSMAQCCASTGPPGSGRQVALPVPAPRPPQASAHN